MKRYRLQVLLTVRKRITAYVDAPDPDRALIHALDPDRLEFDDADFEDFFEGAHQRSVPAGAPVLDPLDQEDSAE